MKPKLSNWYPPEIKPVRKGWYDVANRKKEPCFDPPWFMHWNGRKWDNYAYSPFDCAYSLYSIQDVHWRGLAKEPK